MRSETPNSTNDAAATDSALVLAVRQGDRRAFVEIVARYQAMVCGIALGILGDFAASEDAGQEALLQAWKHFGELRDPENLRAWLGQIARNTALAQLRRRKGTEPLENADAYVDTAPGPDSLAASEDEAVLVRKALAKLPENYRLPLILFYREGQSIRAIAQALQLSEDTAKQRLSRARELLREQMTGMIEHVLSHSGPTAAFTMSIAVAIGALAAPATAAGAIFAATTGASSISAATTATTTKATTTFLSAMSTSKSLVITAALVTAAFVPLGYHVASLLDAQAPQAPTQSRNSSGNGLSQSSVKPAPGFANSALFAEWQSLHQTYGITSESMPAIYKAITELKEPFRRRAFRAALISEWAELDPKGGLAHFLAISDSSQRRQFITEWLERDPQAAVDGLLAGSAGWEKAAKEMLVEIAKRAPERIGEIVGRLPAVESIWDNEIRDAFAIVAERGVEAARTSALGLSGPNRSQALAGVAMAWARTDLDATMAWARSFPAGADRDELVRVALMGRASTDPSDALDRINIVPPGGQEGFFATSTGARVLKAAAEADFNSTVAWITTHPGKLGREDMLGIADAVSVRMNTDPTEFLSQLSNQGSLAVLMEAIDSALLNAAAGQRATIWEWLKAQPDNDATRDLRQRVLRTAGYQDPTLALKFAKEIHDLPDSAQQTTTLVQALFNGGQMLDRLDGLYQQAPEAIRQPLLETGFSLLTPEKLGDPKSWILHLEQLPEGSRARGSEAIARAWADQFPEEAKAWVETLPQGEVRFAATAAMAGAWARNDAPSAANWLSTLPAGSERDRATQAMVSNMADPFHAQAWQWALSISDDTLRQQTATQVIRKIATRDPAQARQWIQAAPFSPEARAAVEASIGVSPSQPKP